MDLLLVAIASILMLPLAAFTTGAARIILGIFFTLFFPGYALIAALFPRKTALDPITRLAFSAGISLALVPIILLVLNFSPWGLRQNPVLIGLMTFTAGMAGIAFLRRRRLNADERSGPAFGQAFSGVSRWWAAQSGANRVLDCLLVVAAAAVIGTVGFVVAKPTVKENFTGFYVLNLQGKAEDYPDQLVVGEKAEVMVGVMNHEDGPKVYRIEVSIDGERAGDVGPINLYQGGKWEQPLSFVATRAGTRQQVKFSLSQEGSDTQQSVHIWVDVRER